MIKYVEYQNFNGEEIVELYKSVEWSNYYLRPELLEKSFKGSLKILAAYSDDELVGIIRVVGDGHSIVYIQDLVVKPEYQRRKIGTTLIKTLLEEYNNVYQIVLLTDDSEKTKEFYRSIGMISSVDYECLAFIKINM